MKMRKFSDGGETVDYVDKDRLGEFIKSRGLDVDKPLPVDTVADDEKVVTDNMRARTSPAAKPPIVTMEQVKKAGFSNLRDYLNDQQGLKPRGTPKAFDKEQQYQRAQEAAQTPEGKARRSAMEKSQALEGSYPVENLAGGAAGLLKAGAGKLFGQGAAKVVAKRVEPTFREKELEVIKEVPRLLEGSKKLALPKPTPKLGYDKAGAKAVERGGRAEGRQAEMLKENARRSGLREDASAETLKAVRDKLGGDKFTVMKHGGSVQGYASGGSVSASRRGDGIAQRGKTRGKMC
jgi:hypothetical protein